MATPGFNIKGNTSPVWVLYVPGERIITLLDGDASKAWLIVCQGALILPLPVLSFPVFGLTNDWLI